MTRFIRNPDLTEGDLITLVSDAFLTFPSVSLLDPYLKEGDVIVFLKMTPNTIRAITANEYICYVPRTFSKILLFENTTFWRDADTWCIGSTTDGVFYFRRVMEWDHP